MADDLEHHVPSYRPDQTTRADEVNRPPEIPVEPHHIDELVAGFVAALREIGLDVPIGCSVVFRTALDVVGMSNHDAVYWAGRSTLVHRAEDFDVYDAAFGKYWGGKRFAQMPELQVEQERTVGIDSDDDTSDDTEDDGVTPDISLHWSNAEVLRDKDFALYDDEEMAEARRLMADMRLVTAIRPSRRQKRAKHDRGQMDLGRTVRAALRTHGEPLHRATTIERDQPRRLILLLDVSGSMESYARALLRFVHAAVVGRRRVEAFALGTRLTRVTRELAERDPDLAIDAATDAVNDWSGGTRLGAVLQDFNDQWGCRGMARGAIVVVLSDGWDRGDTELLGEQMERLHRVAHKLIWVNPLKASPGYEPLAAGMAAALPHLDQFIEGHSITSLEELAAAVAA
jgi:uncharacterized protein